VFTHLKGGFSRTKTPRKRSSLFNALAQAAEANCCREVAAQVLDPKSLFEMCESDSGAVGEVSSGYFRNNRCAGMTGTRPSYERNRGRSPTPGVGSFPSFARDEEATCGQLAWIAAPASASSERLAAPHSWSSGRRHAAGSRPGTVALRRNRHSPVGLIGDLRPCAAIGALAVAHRRRTSGRVCFRSGHEAGLVSPSCRRARCAGRLSGHPAIRQQAEHRPDRPSGRPLSDRVPPRTSP
jgi:hypothetical protein